MPGFGELSYEQIVVEHPEEFSDHAVWYARRALGLPNASPKPPARAVSRVNELTADLLAWVKARRGTDGRIPVFTNQDAASAIGLSDLRTHGRAFGNVQFEAGFRLLSRQPSAARFGRRGTFGGLECGWPTLGVPGARYAGRRSKQALGGRKLRGSLTKSAGAARPGACAVAGRDGGPRGGGARLGFRPGEYHHGTDPERRRRCPREIASSGTASGSGPDGRRTIWVFVCSPKKWAVDQFLDRRVERDSWGVRPSDRERFAPGQLGIVRVGVDRRSASERRGAPPMEPPATTRPTPATPPPSISRAPSSLHDDRQQALSELTPTWLLCGPMGSLASSPCTPSPSTPSTSNAI